MRPVKGSFTVGSKHKSLIINTLRRNHIKKGMTYTHFAEVAFYYKMSMQYLTAYITASAHATLPYRNLNSIVELLNGFQSIGIQWQIDPQLSICTDEDNLLRFINNYCKKLLDICISLDPNTSEDKKAIAERIKAFVLSLGEEFWAPICPSPSSGS